MSTKAVPFRNPAVAWWNQLALRLVLGTALLLPGTVAMASPERGWWFYQTPPAQKPKPKPVVPAGAGSPAPAAAPAQTHVHPCAHAGTWNASCGFVNPGSNFRFQAEERDQLMQTMVMNPQDPNAVLQFQRYNQWLVNKAIQVANMWYFNETQHPGLNPQSTAPISQFGLQLAEKVKRNDNDQIFRYLDKHGMFFYFSRQSCFYCHAMAPNIVNLAKATRVQVEDMSLGSACIPGFENHCMTAAQTTKPAEILRVKIVPTLFLFVEPDTWIRVSTGVVDEATLQARVVDFVAAYRTAILKGVHNQSGLQPSVDFNPADNPASLGGDGKGVTPEKGSPPTAADIRKLLGQSTTPG
ncbi:conjugal transfer protein TraF [Thiomonas sp.]